MKRLYKRGTPLNEVIERYDGVFYHGTTNTGWARIQEDGFIRATLYCDGSKVVCLTPEPGEARYWVELLHPGEGCVVLRIEVTSMNRGKLDLCCHTAPDNIIHIGNISIDKVTAVLSGS